MKVVYPVIHYKDYETTLKEAEIAYRMGADGIFLISHIGNDLDLVPLATMIKKNFNFKVGLNFLSHSVNFTANVVKENNLDMVWSDYCGFSSSEIEDNCKYLMTFAKENKNIEIFASVAFKYQKYEPDPSLAAFYAKSFGFIPTTSGLATGSAPEINKIEMMSKATDGLLAVASGMSVQNIELFKPYLSHVLVSTGVSSDEYHFDRDKLSLFINLFKS